MKGLRFGPSALGAALIATLSPGPAGALDLFAQHEVTVQFATPDGKPMADAEVRVFAPGHRDRPALTGHTDSSGKFQFPANDDGFWRAEAHVGSEIASVMVRVGAASAPQSDEPPSPIWLVGGLSLLLVLAFAFRMLRARNRRRRS